MEHSDDLLPDTADRVPANTSEEVNRRIRRETDARVADLAALGPSAIEERLDELEEEWDIERAIEANAATLALTGLALGAFVDRRFLALPAVVASFLLQHAVQGWCPPVPVMRRLGVRTQREIDDERSALKALRGDFASVRPDEGLRSPRESAEQALAAARA